MKITGCISTTKKFYGLECRWISTTRIYGSSDPNTNEYLQQEFGSFTWNFSQSSHKKYVGLVPNNCEQCLQEENRVSHVYVSSLRLFYVHIPNSVRVCFFACACDHRMCSSSFPDVDPRER
ncbi:hypothetical protein NPIL_342851 [Nephila pilipes]|uniref:Uncharacterized protein n=1 Tax=Nephila pilipes TaxID=299642 RepID=A0A8X6P447_NEPPI|nr:hypothetical protein NPIL_342851 [Nephila pilipes]